jgi:hypothetical protein
VRQMRLQIVSVLLVAAVCGTFSRPVRGGETLYNGIVLPSQWPPNIRTIGSTPAPAPSYLQNPPSVIPINVGRQLFVDSFLIESTTLTQKFHAATVHSNPVLAPDKSWESGIGGNPPSAMTFSDGVWYDPQDKSYKMWYTAGYNQATAYARSADGIHWEKPTLDVVPGTNIVYNTPHDSTTVWLDQQTTDPSQRYKLMARENASGQHTIRYSADGIHWGGAVATSGAAFDRSTFFYNPFRNRWAMSLRGDAYNPSTETVSGTYAGRGASGGGMISLPRMRRYAEGTTLVGAATSWAGETFGSDQWYANTTAPTMWVGADSLDPARPDIGATPELYNLDAVAYESVMTGMFSIYRGVPANYPDREKINNIVAGFSRDGFSWDRTNRKPIIDVSEDSSAWNYANVQSAGGCLLTVGDQLFLYSSGRQARNAGAGSTGLSTMRRDGFASMDAGQQGGTVTTRPVSFSGKYLFVNTDDLAGQLQAEVLDQNGNVIGPFSRQNCVAVSSDSTTARISWNGVSDLSSLAGQPVKFRFYLSGGSLYSFWVSPDRSGASYGYVGAGGPGFTGPTDTVGTSGTQLVSLKTTADTVISKRADRRVLNAGHATSATIGVGGGVSDNQDAIMRFALSELHGKVAAGNGTLTLSQLSGQLPKNFHGQTLDLYAMPANNADWEEGAGNWTAVAGAAWNRKKGPCTNSPLTANKWLPSDANDPTSGLRLIDSIVWSDALGSDDAVFTLSKGDLDQWLSDGVVSFLIRSNSAEALMNGGDFTQRLWYAATLETGVGALGARLAFAVEAPEPGAASLLLSGLTVCAILAGRRFALTQATRLRRPFSICFSRSNAELDSCQRL